MAEKELVIPFPGMRITDSVSFHPGVYNFFGKEGITIEGENIQIEGNGSVFIGGKPKERAEENQEEEDFSYGYGAMKDGCLGYYGTGFTLEHCKNVILTGVSARGFERGLYLKESSGCTVKNCDFSYNYHNPDWGWEEHLDLGGMILENSHNNELSKNRAGNVWSALVLKNSNGNRILENDCSHTSNVGVRLWLACDNVLEDNDFSWGIRKKPDEVHARDSSCVLIESGSCRNVFRCNDMRYGGDGLFVRSLNNQMSRDNLFEENDTSFANNNAIEAWDAGNTYIRNKANYSSYGFWLGCSDHTKLIENEVLGNGTVFKNAPESFGNAGIAVVNGSGHDFYLEGNVISENAGPGIAIRNKAGDPSRNWILKGNTITGNKSDSRGYVGHGIYMKHALNVHLMDNCIKDNDGLPVFQDGDTAEIHIHEPGTACRRDEILGLDTVMELGEERTFSLGQTYEAYEFVSDRGHVFREMNPRVTFCEPGRYRWYALGHKDGCLGYAVNTCYVMPKGTELFAEQKRVCQEKARTAGEQWEIPAASLEEQNCLCLLYHYENDFIDWNKEVCDPKITLRDAKGKTLVVQPKHALLAQNCVQANEAKYEMELLYLPLQQQEGFTVEREEGFGGKLSSMTVELSTPLESVGVFTILRAALLKKDWAAYETVCSIKGLTEEQRAASVHFSNGAEYEILEAHPFQYGNSGYWVSEAQADTAWVEIKLGYRVPMDRIRLCFYTDGGDIALPETVRILGGDGELLFASGTPEGCWITVQEPKMCTDCIRIELGKKEEKRVALRQVLIEKKQTPGITVKSEPSQECVVLTAAEVKLNLENCPGGQPFTSLNYRLYETCKEELAKSVLLYESRLEPEEIHPGRETVLPFPNLQLKRGCSYHLMLFPEKAAENNTQPYYRWTGNGIAAMDGTYGYENNGTFVNTGKTGWGRAYLRLYFEGRILDLTTDNEGMGNRFGLPEMEKIFQIFEIPDQQDEVTAPNFLQYQAGIRLEGRKTVTIVSKEQGARAALWLAKEQVEKIETDLPWKQEGQKLIFNDLKAGANIVVLTAFDNRILCII